jgi:hypothetical protein
MMWSFELLNAKTFTPEPEVDMADHHQHGDGYSADGSEYMRVRC